MRSINLIEVQATNSSLCWFVQHFIGVGCTGTRIIVVCKWLMSMVRKGLVWDCGKPNSKVWLFMSRKTVQMTTHGKTMYGMVWCGMVWYCASME